MILGIGNDIIEISRIEKTIDRYGQKFLDRIFTEKEQQYCLKHAKSTRNFSGRFAAKEAIVKAIGTGIRDGVSWLDIEITNDDLGKPIVHLSERLKQKLPKAHILISISHSHTYATAVAIYTQT